MSFYINQHTEVTQVSTWQDSSLAIMRWGQSNSYPQTLINLISQSPSAYTAVNRAAQFYKGRGFEQEDVIVTPTGLTLKDIVSIMADDYAYFNAFALHGNYNLERVISSIYPMRISTLRFNEFDELNYASKVGYHPNFGLNSVERKTIERQATRGDIKWFNRFNPSQDVVEKQIKNSTGGLLGNYNGQVLYYSDSGHSSYPVPKLQSPINYVLSDIENSILVRKETATGFTNTYLLKTTLSAESDTLARLEKTIAESQGARGAGGVITFSDLSPEEVNGTLLEEIGSGGSGSKSTIEAAILTQELDQKVISGAYLIPPVLAGIPQANGFSGVDLEDAYNVFNAVTQNGRDTIEQQLNRMIKASKWADIGKIKIKPLSLDKEINEQDEPIQAAPINRNPLTGRQEQGLQRISRKYNKGQLSYEQAYDQLKTDYNFTDDRIEIWLPKSE